VTAVEGVIISTVIAGVLSLIGVLWSSRSATRSSMYDTLVKAYEAVTTENERLRNEKALDKQRINDLEAQLARCYGQRAHGEA